MKRPIDTDIPLPSERFQSAIEKLDKAIKTGKPDLIADANEQLAFVAWNLAHAVVYGLQLVEAYR